MDTSFIKLSRSEWVRLRTLVSLRWLAILGQILAVLGAHFILNVSFEIYFCFLTIGLSIILNVVCSITLPSNKRLSQYETILMLMFDLCQLSILLYLTGGINNPFSLFILAPIIIAATTLNLGAIISLALAAISLIVFLTLYNMPIINPNGIVSELPYLLQWGSCAALVTSIIFIAAYVRRISLETFLMSRALLATQMALDREHKLSLIGGVVAATAHEMGTPLATIKLTAAELQEELVKFPELQEDAILIYDQANRLASILKDMGRGGKDDPLLKTTPLISLMHEAAEPHEARGKKIHYFCNGLPDQSEIHNVPIVYRSPEIIHGIRNLVQNAVDFANKNIWIHAIWDNKYIKILVMDDGKGYSSELIGRIGDPFLAPRTKHKVHLGQNRRTEYEGLGLGLFIAKTLLERSKAELFFFNAETLRQNNPSFVFSKQATGAIVTVQWNRASIEASKTKPKSNQRLKI